MHEFRIPLAAKPRATGTVLFGNPWIALKVLGDAQGVWDLLVHFAIYILHQGPAIGQIATGVIVETIDVADEGRGIPAQSIHVVFLQPHQGIVSDECSHFPASVVEA